MSLGRLFIACLFALGNRKRFAYSVTYRPLTSECLAVVVITIFQIYSFLERRTGGRRGAHTVSRLFISHSSANNRAATALAKWLSEQGYNDVYLDIDPDRGIAAGERWQKALKAAADRCQAVLCLISPAWLDSRWCLAEFLLAKTLSKRIFGLLIEPV